MLPKTCSAKIVSALGKRLVRCCLRYCGKGRPEFPGHYLRGTSLASAVLMGSSLFGSLLPLGGCAPKRVYRQPHAEQPQAVVREARLREVAEPSHPGLEAVNEAIAQLGRPYRWGGNRPGLGFDCSGLVQWSYGRAGIDLPRVVKDQSRSGHAVDVRDLEPGDLVFFRIRGNRVSHVGIHVGAGQFVHAPRAGQAVRVDRLDDPYWRERMTGSRRIIVP